MKKIVLILVISLVVELAHSQNFTKSKIDSVLSKYSSESVLNTDFNNFFEKNKQVYDQAIKIGYKKGIATSAVNLSSVYQTQQDYPTALKYSNEAYSIAIQEKDTNIITESLLTLANIYWSTNDVQKSKRYYESALNISVKNKDYESAAYSLYGYGIIYFVNDSTLPALHKFHEALAYAKKTKNNSTLMSAIYMEIGILNYYKFRNLDSAKYYYEKTNAIAIANNDNMQIGISSMLLSDIASSKKDLKSAKEILSIAVEKIKAFNDYNRLNQIYSRIAVIDANTNNFKSAYKNLLEAYSLKDSVVTQDKTKEITTLKLNSEFEKEKEVLALKKQQEQAILNQKIHSEHVVNYFLYATAGLFLLVAIATFRSYRIKQKSNSLLEAKNKEIEHQKSEIVDSINYAKRIQTATLGSPERVVELYNNAAVIFQPKDIVSGDFYWFHKIGNRFMFSVADCTGHGVPGAMMSMIGNNGLNDAVKEKGITDPAKVLEHLSLQVHTNFNKNVTEIKDGMDITFCELNTDTKVLEFAGAINPLIICKWNGEIVEIKGDKQFIGQKDSAYTNHSIQLEKGDCVYIMSDGFVDQFGGSNNKKFKISNFKSLLPTINSHEAQYQAGFLTSTINDWKGTTEQTDDICVMVVKI
jgi:serine phosphatase RsbU (regulator of sigma subunit)